MPKAGRDLRLCCSQTPEVMFSRGEAQMMFLCVGLNITYMHQIPLSLNVFEQNSTFCHRRSNVVADKTSYRPNSHSSKRRLRKLVIDQMSWFPQIAGTSKIQWAVIQIQTKYKYK